MRPPRGRQQASTGRPYAPRPNPGSARTWLALPFACLLVLLTAAGASPLMARAPRSSHDASALALAQPRVPAQFARILRVPADYPTIQAAVDAAQPDDLVLVAPGVYHEAVRVKSPGVTIRGEDRNATILDGQSKLPNGFTVTADNVVVENMTAHHYVGNGFFWSGVQGYRGSYLTAYDNGDYGIYAFGSRMGEFDDSYASGSPDSGFYIGQCFPCDALITRVTSEHNALGYSGTNAGGSLVIRDSEWDHNGTGILPNTLDSEKLAPEHGATVVHNYVHDNGVARVPSFPLEYPSYGVGIGVPGGDLNYIADNRVERNTAYGILVSGIIDTNLWLASGNVVARNTVRDSGIADLALAAPSGANNCFADNHAATTLPPLLEVTHGCGSPWALNGGGDMSVTERLFSYFQFANGPNYRSPDFRAFPAPPAQPGMPDVGAGPASLFTDGYTPDDATNGGLPAAVGTGGPNMLLPLGFTGYTIVQVLLGLYGNWSLFALYAVWLAVAFVELGQRPDLSGGRRLGLGALVVGVPILGPILYYFAGGSKLSRGFRLALVVGAPVLCLGITILLLVVASFTL
jgi:Right handed beta helix region